MSYCRTDPMETIISDGRLKPKPVRHLVNPEILTVDLDLMASSLQRNLEKVLLKDHRVMKFYRDYDSADAANQLITSDITAMVNYAIGCTYTHLRGILEWYCITALFERMEPEFPIPNAIQFPAWISSTLASIGAFLINNGPRPSHTVVVYAPAATYMENYGRKTKAVFDDMNYWRLLHVLNEIGVATSPFPRPSREDLFKFWKGEWSGSYFPMIKPKLKGHSWSYYGYVDESHYENEDVARIALVTSEGGVTPFEQFGLMKPSGDECYYQSQLGHSIDSSQVLNLLRYRILRRASHPM